MPIFIWPFGSNCRILKRYLFFFWEQFKEKNVFAYCLCCQRLRQTKQKNGKDYFIFMETIFLHSPFSCLITSSYVGYIFMSFIAGEGGYGMVELSCLISFPDKS